MLYIEEVTKKIIRITKTSALAIGEQIDRIFAVEITMFIFLDVLVWLSDSIGSTGFEPDIFLLNIWPFEKLQLF